MSEALFLAGVTAVGFAATNLDSLLLLVSLLAERGAGRRSVITGYGLSVAVVLVIAWLAAQAGDWIPPRLVNLLGLVPIAMGLRGLLGLWRGSDGDEVPRAALTGTSSVALLMLSVSSDNFGVFVPLFAETPRTLDPVILGAALVTALTWIVLALWLSRVPKLRVLFARWGPPIVPFLLISMGIYILFDTATDLQ